MRNLEDIESDLAAARETLSSVKGTPAEVYSRIVGYYRSVRNWNRGKREEYGERRLYHVMNDELRAAALSLHFSAKPDPIRATLLLLFVRTSCPGCTPAKAAAERLGIPVQLLNADMEEGMAEAMRRNVLTTPTAILLSSGGQELARATDVPTISRLLEISEPVAV
ncbi:MAG: hypothetical protein LBH42_07625 [Treponema sp.]|jgi:ribonucleoside-triphosphate reductase|nr:hypothetical protein [Treponema sp.]